MNVLDPVEVTHLKRSPGFTRTNSKDTSRNRKAAAAIGAQKRALVWGSLAMEIWGRRAGVELWGKILVEEDKGVG